ncbi:hypothetical protein Tdes44962_MAKER09622 [Teratosphaeria destructans]|uniref:Uncharacterized protein n=1 Tax=Teratosphaeria destructans TaxID=418781 RepID=A0A9W7SSF8_9PEZI|nr:hypothetical protein Tdes44962_MAKER09622 [Teratosphaeria destructans]
MDSFTHAVFRVDAADDPKAVLEGLKRVVYALRPKGVAIVVHARVESGRVEEGGGSLQVALEDRMRFQSRGRVEGLEDVMYHAGFERGKIRRLRDEEGVEVVVGMKWDQLTA